MPLTITSRLTLRMGAAAALLSLALLAVPAVAQAAPVKLKLAWFAADNSMDWLSTIKPWADAVNEAGKGVIEIDTFPNGALGRAMPQQAQMILDGVADIAFVVPGITPGRFPDNEVMDLPGLFPNMKVATLVYTRLIQKHVLRGFDDYYVIGAMATPSFEIDAKAKITTLDDLKGKRIRVTNPSQAQTMKALGAVPILMPPPDVPEAIGRGTIDGATEFPGVLYDFGIARVTKYDYFLPVGISSLTLLMNKKKFDAMPKAAQDIVMRYSGDWFANRWIAFYGKYLDSVLAKMKADKNRVVTMPSQQELERADVAFQQVRDAWLKKDPRNAQLLQTLQDEVTKLHNNGG